MNGRRLLRYDPNDPPVCPCLFPFSHSERIKRVHVRIWLTDISRFLEINRTERNIVDLYGERALVEKFLQDERTLEQALRSSIAAQDEIPAEFYDPDPADDMEREIFSLRQEISRRTEDYDSDQTVSDEDPDSDVDNSAGYPTLNWGGGYAETVDSTPTTLSNLVAGLFDSSSESTDEQNEISDSE